MENLEITRETLQEEVWRLNRVAIAKKKDYLSNLYHFRKAIDNERALYSIVQTRRGIISDEDILIIETSIIIEQDNIEKLRAKSFTLYAEYDLLSDQHSQKNSILKTKINS